MSARIRARVVDNRPGNGVMDRDIQHTYRRVLRKPESPLRPYYVSLSAASDGKYDIAEIFNALYLSGVTYGWTANQFGWSNQPPVACFRTEPERLDRIKDAIEERLGFYPIIHEIEEEDNGAD